MMPTDSHSSVPQDAMRHQGGEAKTWGMPPARNLRSGRFQVALVDPVRFDPGWSNQETEESHFCELRSYRTSQGAGTTPAVSGMMRGFLLGCARRGVLWGVTLFSEPLTAWICPNQQVAVDSLIGCKAVFAHLDQPAFRNNQSSVHDRPMALCKRTESNIVLPEKGSLASNQSIHRAVMRPR